MRKPATGRRSGAGLSRNDLTKLDGQFIADLPQDNQVTDRNLLLGHLRAVWWSQWREGVRLPAERDVILITGGLKR